MSAPVISYPPELPVSAARDEIARAIADHQVVIVAGATGSGKTTQLPKIAYELGRRTIAHTQPRRLAARTIAERVAEELQVTLGGEVGYRVRFTDQASASTAITLMTDGILLAEIHRDRLLKRYDTIIIDEAHERSLNVDFLLGYLKQLLPQRRDLKVIVTSATIDPGSFAEHFAAADGTPAPVIEVSGRTFPVEIRYRPLVSSGATATSRADDPPDSMQEVIDERSYDADDEVSAIVAALRELDLEPRGDVLVFLPGEAEIRDAADAVRGAFADARSPVEVLPLFGRLSAADQHRVFEPSKVAGLRRRIILATNVAETSLTVPGIKYVIDAGTARISRYSARAKVQRLPIEAVSQASAQQRSGRAGRTSAGIAIRLYSHDDFAKRPEFTEPEVLRTSLASVILQMLSLDFGRIERFPFLTSPDSRGIRAALDLLAELGAVVTAKDGTPRLTRTGSDIARLPIDPRFARMIVEAERSGVVHEVLPIVAALTMQDVRERPDERREQADQAHARFADPTSDFLTLLDLWNYLRKQSTELGSSAFRRLCKTEFLHYVRVREWFDVHRQLQDLTKTKRQGSGENAAPDAVHRAILSGLLSQIGVLDEHETAKSPRGARAEYRGARGVKFQVFPGSALRKRKPQAVMAAELVETSRLFARTVAQIDPAWAESLAGDLAKRQVSEPHWSKDSGAAIAYEKVTLYGVEIVARRRIQFAGVDRPAARELFLQHALVEGDWHVGAIPQHLTAFVRQNFELRRRLEKVEERERRRDILAGDEAVFAFYDARVPHEVFDVRSFEAWWKDARIQHGKLLTMRESDLLDGEATSDARDFPSSWQQGDLELRMAYRFEPGADDDGVSVLVPLPLLVSLQDSGFDWQVPGLRDELIAALLKALPKALRRHVVPAADWAATFSADLRGHGPEDQSGLPSESLLDALAGKVQRQASAPVTARDFDLDRVPPHLRLSFRAVDHRGQTLGSSRSLAEVQQRFADRARASLAKQISKQQPAPTAAVDEPRVEQSGLTDWTFRDLAQSVNTRVAGGVVRGYPALVDRGDSVDIRIETSEALAERATKLGIRRLLLLRVPSPTSYVQDHLTANEKLALAASPYSSAKAVIEDVRAAVTDDVIAECERTSGAIRTRAQFDAALRLATERSIESTLAGVALTSRILLLSREAERDIKGATSMTLLSALGDIRGQLAALLPSGFVSAAGLARLQHLPRYLEAVRSRIASLVDNPSRDRAWMSEYERAATAFTDAGGTLPLSSDAPDALVQARWMLEEFRVSLFAQRLGTAEPVSLKRIQKMLAGT